MRTVEAVRGVDLTVERGEILGFLGRNGAGKTTTLRMLTTLLAPTGGTATVAGRDLARDPEGVPRRIGYVAQSGPLLTKVQLGTAGSSWQTLVPGLMIQLGLFSAVFAGFGILIEKQHGIVERMRITPVSRVVLLLGRALKDVLVLLVQSLRLVLVALPFGLRAPVANVALGFVFVGW